MNRSIRIKVYESYSTDLPIEVHESKFADRSLLIEIHESNSLTPSIGDYQLDSARYLAIIWPGKLLDVFMDC